MAGESLHGLGRKQHVPSRRDFLQRPAQDVPLAGQRSMLPGGASREVLQADRVRSGHRLDQRGKQVFLLIRIVPRNLDVEKAQHAVADDLGVPVQPHSATYNTRRRSVAQ